MSKTNITNWIRTGLLALPVYGLLTFWSTLDPHPDQNKDPEAWWARFVSAPSYLVSHLFGSNRGYDLRAPRHLRPRRIPRK